MKLVECQHALSNERCERVRQESFLAVSGLGEPQQSAYLVVDLTGCLLDVVRIEATLCSALNGSALDLDDIRKARNAAPARG